MKMTKFRIVLLSILIPLFIITAVFFYVYNSTQSQTTRKLQAIISAQQSLKQDIDNLTLEDMKRFDFEMQQLKNLMDKKEFSLKGINIKGILKHDAKILGELEFFREKIRRCRDHLKLIDLEQEKYTEKYEALVKQLNKSLTLLSFFTANYTQAIKMDEIIIGDLEKFATSESQEMVLKPLERYYKQAKTFKNMFVASLNSSIAEFNAIFGKKIAAESAPQYKDVEVITNNLLAKNYKILGKIKEDIDNDRIDELVVLSAAKDENIVEIYDFKNNAYEKIWENNLGKTPAKALFVRYYSLIPEVVVFPSDTVFKYNGKEYKMSQ